MTKSPDQSHREHGVVLVTTLMFMAILSVLGTGAYLTSSVELKISSNYKIRKQAFYDAEAGLQYAIGRIKDGLAKGTLYLTGSTVSVNYAAPTGFLFDTITTLTRVGATSNYRFQVTSHRGNASSTVEAVIARDYSLQYCVFGDSSVDIKSSRAVYSYDSRTTPIPISMDSIGKADVVSNGKVSLHSYTYVDGDVALGDDGAGTEGIYDPHGIPGPTVVGQEGLDVDRVDPDPLGAVGGTLATYFMTYSHSGSNDNADAGPAIVEDSIDLSSGQTATLVGKTGGAHYHLTGLALREGSTLNIDSTLGPVRIYLTGPLRAQNGSVIYITGNPTDFTIYANSPDDIVFQHEGDLKGTVYAPYAKVVLRNNGDVCGMIWAKEVLVDNSGALYGDMAPKDELSSNDVSLVSWREIRN